jgi:hypothetical protein
MYRIGCTELADRKPGRCHLGRCGGRPGLRLLLHRFEAISKLRVQIKIRYEAAGVQGVSNLYNLGLACS